MTARRAVTATITTPDGETAAFPVNQVTFDPPIASGYAGDPLASSRPHTPFPYKHHAGGGSDGQVVTPGNGVGGNGGGSSNAGVVTVMSYGGGGGGGAGGGGAWHEPGPSKPQMAMTMDLPTLARGLAPLLVEELQAFAAKCAPGERALVIENRRLKERLDELEKAYAVASSLARRESF